MNKDGFITNYINQTSNYNYMKVQHMIDLLEEKKLIAIDYSVNKILILPELTKIMYETFK